MNPAFNQQRPQNSTGGNRLGLPVRPETGQRRNDSILCATRSQARATVSGTRTFCLIHCRVPMTDPSLEQRTALPEQHNERPSATSPPPLWRAYGAGMAMAALASVLAVILESVLHNGTLVLLFVLVVAAVGLRFGTLPALATALVSFLSFNFFLTEPRYTLMVAQQDDLSTLFFLLVLALVCGSAAARIRNQFSLLKESSHYSDTLRELAQRLAPAQDDAQLWTLLAAEFGRSLPCRAVVQTSKDAQGFLPDTLMDLSVAEREALAICWQQGIECGRFSTVVPLARWSIFPLRQQGKMLAVVLLEFDAAITRLQTCDRDLIAAMLQQTADARQRLHLAQELETTRIKAEMEQLRSALLSSVSHDLRSPLSAMMGAADSLRVLDLQLDPADRRELVDTILQECHRLDRYIQNLLDMTRLGHGTLKIERDWVSLADIIGSALARLKRCFPAVKTEFHALQDSPLLHVHAALVEQALFNILENAARFSPPDETIVVRVATDAGVCRISIEDRGPGIPAAEQEKIFDMFHVVAGGDQKKNNTGMGLAICRGMIAAHGGSVRALPGHGNQGTCFVVELPMTPPDTGASE